MISELDDCEGTLGITVLASGSAGNATLIHHGDKAILVDAGISLKELKTRMKSCNLAPDIQAVLVTHEHADHVKGLRVIANAFDVPIYTTRLCCEKLLEYDAKLRNIKIFMPGGEFDIAGVKVSPFSISHDAVDTVAFTFECEGRKIGVATDLGRPSQMVEFRLRDCDVMLLESNHDLNLLAESTRPWQLKQRILGPIGHLSNRQFCELFPKVVSERTRTLLLGHVSRECNTYEVAEATARCMLDAIHREDIRLKVARQDRPLETVWA